MLRCNENAPRTLVLRCFHTIVENIHGKMYAAVERFPVIPIAETT